MRVGNREIAIFNLGDRFLAVDNRCPHKGGSLADGIVSGAAVVCPLHAWKMSLETGKGVSSASASSCIETFRTRVEHGVIVLEVTAHGFSIRRRQREGSAVTLSRTGHACRRRSDMQSRLEEGCPSVRSQP